MSKILSYTELGHLKWKVPSNILISNDLVKLAFIRGFFDGDGTVSRRNVRFFSTNKKALKQVSILLVSLGFNPRFRGPYIKIGRKPYYVIQILSSDRESFLKSVKPISKRLDLCGDILKTRV